MQQLGAEPRQPVLQLAGRLVRRRSHRAHGSDRPGVEPLLQPHERHAGLRVAGQHGRLDRRRAAPARQQRGVNVDAAAARDVQHLARQQQPVGHDHDQIGREPRGSRRGLRHRVFRLAGCSTSMPWARAHCFTGPAWRWRPRPAGPVGLGEHGDDLVARTGRAAPAPAPRTPASRRR